MSDTPRTDEKLLMLCTDCWEGGSGWMESCKPNEYPSSETYVHAAFARELERELAEAKAENARLRRVADLARDAVESGAIDEIYLSLLRDELAALPKPDGFERRECVSQTISDGSPWLDKAGPLSFQAEIDLSYTKQEK